MVEVVRGDVVEWLLQGDPAIRWQTLRDLQQTPEAIWQAERRRTLGEGWGAQFLAQQAPDGTWGGGIYSPKWISTTYTLLNLIALGIPREHGPARKGAGLVLDGMYGATRDTVFYQRLKNADRCLVGMALQIAVYFGVEDGRVDALVENLLGAMMPDGGWNCRHLKEPATHHSSFHTTLNVLEGLREWLELTPQHALRADVLGAEKKALELLLAHRLYRSDKTGEVIEPRFALLSHPHYWHYDVMRGLDYFARADAGRDERLADAIGLLLAGRRPDGCWRIQYRYAAKVYFHMERMGAPSRWNTLRALRVLRWWQN